MTWVLRKPKQVEGHGVSQSHLRIAWIFEAFGHRARALKAEIRMHPRHDGLLSRWGSQAYQTCHSTNLAPVCVCGCWWIRRKLWPHPKCRKETEVDWKRMQSLRSEVPSPSLYFLMACTPSWKLEPCFSPSWYPHPLQPSGSPCDHTSRTVCIDPLAHGRTGDTSELSHSTWIFEDSFLGNIGEKWRMADDLSPSFCCCHFFICLISPPSNVLTWNGPEPLKIKWAWTLENKMTKARPSPFLGPCHLVKTFFSTRRRQQNSISSNPGPRWRDFRVPFRKECSLQALNGLVRWTGALPWCPHQFQSGEGKNSDCGGSVAKSGCGMVG